MAFFRLAQGRPLLRDCITLVLRVSREMREDDVTHLAAGVSYFAIFSIFPILLGFLAIGGVLLDSEVARREFLQVISDNLPGSEEFVAVIVPVATHNIRTLVDFKGPLAIISLIGMLWSATGVYAAISRAVDRAWDIPYNRPYIIAKTRQVVMCLAMGIPFLLSSMAASVVSAVSALAKQELTILGGWLHGGLAKVILLTLDWGLILLVFLVAYRFVPNTKTYWKYVWLGAIVATLLYQLGRHIFIWYLGNLASYDTVYGPVSSIMVFLFWIYLTALVLILGAEISSEYERMRQPRVEQTAANLLNSQQSPVEESLGGEKRS